jgi:hypothetical protein
MAVVALLPYYSKCVGGESDISTRHRDIMIMILTTTLLISQLICQKLGIWLATAANECNKT